MSDRQERWTLEDITALFDGIFAERYQTRLIRGGDEPLYRPANSETPYHQVIFARGYYASALHEISHWCIAGAQRRQQEDYFQVTLKRFYSGQATLAEAVAQAHATLDKMDKALPA